MRHTSLSSKVDKLDLQFVFKTECIKLNNTTQNKSLLYKIDFSPQGAGHTSMIF